MSLCLPHYRGRLRRGSGRRRRVLTGVLGFLLIAVLLVFVQTRPHRLAQLGAGLLERVTGATAVIDRAHLTATGEVELMGVALRLPGDARLAASLFHAERIVLRPDPVALLAGRIEAKSIRVIRPSLYVTEDLSTGLYTLQLLSPSSDEGDDGAEQGAALPDRLPSLLMRDAMLHFGTRDEAGMYRALGVVPLDGQLIEEVGGSSAYRFVLSRPESGGGGGVEADAGFSVVGRLDLEARSLDVRMEGQGEVRRYFMPSVARAWWERLDPEATLSQLRVRVDPDAGRRIEIGLTGGALTLPIGEQPPRFEGVSGGLTITDDRLEIVDLAGLAEGLPFVVNGWLGGLDPRVDPLGLTVDIEPVDLPEEPGIIFGLPPVVKKEYDRFTPTGRFAARARISRERPGDELAYAADIRLIDVTAAYHRFPLPLEAVRGVIRVDPAGVWIDGLTAEAPGEADVTIAGSIAPANNAGVIDLSIDGVGLKLDESLLGVMEPGQRRAFETFFDPAGYASLVADGLVGGEDGEAKPQSGGAGFAFGGAIDLGVRVTRPGGGGHPLRVVSTVRVGEEALGVVPSFWRYPLSAVSGAVVIAPESIGIESLELVTPTDGSAVVTGVVDRPTRSTIAPRVRIERADLPIDRLLIESIPEAERKWVSDLHFSGGRLAAEGLVSLDEAGAIDWAIDARVVDGAAHPFLGGYELAGVTGGARLTRDAIELTGIEGEHDRATHTIDGVVRWAEPAAIDLRLGGRRVEVSDALLGLIPPDLGQRAEVAELFATYKPRGVTDATVRLTLPEAADEVVDGAAVDGEVELDVELLLEPRRLTVEYQGQDVRATSMGGAVRVKGDDIALEALSGNFGGKADGWFEAWGHATRQEPRRLAVNFKAGSRAFDSNTRGVLPTEVTAALEAMSFDGGYEIVEGRLVHAPGATGDEPMLDFAARVNLTGVSLDVGVEIAEMDGAMELSAQAFADRLGPGLELAMVADRLTIERREVSPMRLLLRTDPDGRELEIVEARGSMYGGTAVLQGRVGLLDDARASLEAQLVGVELGPFREPGGDESDGAEVEVLREHDALGEGAGEEVAWEPEEQTTGRLDARLALDFALDEPGDRLGHGAFSVTEARLYEQPLATTLLDTLNLSLPGTSHFDRASAVFAVAGDRVVFDEVRIEAVGNALAPSGGQQTTIEIVGDGSMAWEAQTLDLLLVTRNPGWPHLGPLSDLFNVVKDQLVAVVVEGTLEEPVVRPASLTALSHPRTGEVLSEMPEVAGAEAGE
ncbi:MAG: hypothetical protein AAF823_12815 [Planctomycetota bacterium]